MKLTSFLGICALAILASSSCKSKAKQDAQDLAAGIRESTTMGNRTSESGYSMKANVDGKDWIAEYMIPDEHANGMFRIQGQKGTISMGFYINTRTLNPGDTRNFGETNAVDLFTNDENGGIYGGYSGMVSITKNDGKWVEGNFNFTGTTSRSSKTIPVSDGFFRVPIPYAK